MDGWVSFWTIMSIVGFVSFYLLVLIVVPLGALDLIAFFRHLNRERMNEDNEKWGE